MQISVIIHSPECVRGIRFIRAALEAGHEVPMVFFYHEGVRAADRAATDCAHSEWLDLSTQHDLELAVCIGAAARRGLLNESALVDPDGSVAPGFEVVGLGQLISAIAEADRVVTFA